jgi:CRISPR-associated protein (Cas_Cmr3)
VNYLVVFRPVDVLAPRAGTPFDAGSSLAARAVVPRPSTITRAVATCFGENPNHVIGPIAVVPHRDTYKPLFATPADLVGNEGVIERLDWGASSQPGTVNSMADVVRGPAGDGDALGGYLNSESMENYLLGGCEPKFLRDLSPLTPFSDSTRAVISLEGRQVQQSMLGRVGILHVGNKLFPKQKPGWDRACIGAVVRTTNAITLKTDLVSLGGEGHKAHVSLLPLPDDFWPSQPTEFPDCRVLLSLITPAIFEGGAFPSLPHFARLVGAVSIGPESVAMGDPEKGWSLRLAASAGSVFVVEFPNEDSARNWVINSRPSAWGSGSSVPLCLGQATRELRTAGFGAALVGSVSSSKT